MLGFGSKKAKEAPAEELAPVAPILPDVLVEENPAPDTVPAPAPATPEPSETPAYVPRERRCAPQE